MVGFALNSTNTVAPCVDHIAVYIYMHNTYSVLYVLHIAEGATVVSLSEKLARVRNVSVAIENSTSLDAERGKRWTCLQR